MLSDSEARQFFQDGYVVLHGIIAEQDLTSYREAFERLVDKVQANPRKEYGTRTLDEKNNHGSADDATGRARETWGCNSLLHPDLYERAFTDFFENERLLSALSSILGPDMRYHGLKALWSSDRIDYDLIWHRDGPDTAYTPDGSQTHVQFNTALYEDASFRLVPGSHRRPLTDVELRHSRTTTQRLDDEINPTLQPGDSLLMHSHLFHRGGAPAGARRRTLHTLIASASKPVYSEDLASVEGWFAQARIEDHLGPLGQRLFERFLAWKGRDIPKA